MYTVRRLRNRCKRHLYLAYTLRLHYEPWKFTLLHCNLYADAIIFSSASVKDNPLPSFTMQIKCKITLPLPPKCISSVFQCIAYQCQLISLCISMYLVHCFYTAQCKPSVKQGGDFTLQEPNKKNSTSVILHCATVYQRG